MSETIKITPEQITAAITFAEVLDEKWSIDYGYTCPESMKLHLGKVAIEMSKQRFSSAEEAKRKYWEIEERISRDKNGN